MKENHMRFLQIFLDILEWATEGSLHYDMGLPGFLRAKSDQRYSSVWNTFRSKTAVFPPQFYSPPTPDTPFAVLNLASRITKLEKELEKTHSSGRQATTQGKLYAENVSYSPDTHILPFSEFKREGGWDGIDESFAEAPAESARYFWAKHGQVGRYADQNWDSLPDLCYNCEDEECICLTSSYHDIHQGDASQYRDCLTNYPKYEHKTDLRVSVDNTQDKLSEVLRK
ncbi:hypothetical protein GGR57DRAFT_513422 [Xylariaceae sp. FL1272]|nr:hypothetical protein GGR57DRAFT_513422 [Xylariaceae sp. FL1272]